MSEPVAVTVTGPTPVVGTLKTPPAVSIGPLGNNSATLDQNGHLFESELPASVVSDSRAAAPGDLLVAQSEGESIKFVRLAKGTPGQQIVVRSDGTVAYIPTGEVYLSAWTKKGPSEDCTADFQAALEAAQEANATLVLPERCTLMGEVKLANAANPEWNMRGSGPTSSIIVDKNPSGPCLSYKRTDTKSGQISWSDFGLTLGVDKPATHMVELGELRQADLHIKSVWWERSGENHCLSGLYMSQLWEGSFNNCRWNKLLGHPVWYDCPTLNGGNIAFNDCQAIFCSNGMFVKGAETTNNVQFKNCKFYSTANEFYEKLTSGIPAVGATEITLAKGIEAGYFQRNGCVLLYSAAGLDVMHLAANEAPYNSETGVLKFRNATTKAHNSYSDLRVICCTSWSVITDFLCPSMTFIGSHFEQSPAFLKDAPNAKFENCEISLNQKAYTAEARGVYLAGLSSGHSLFKDSFMQHPIGTATSYAMVCPLAPAPAGTSGEPTFEIDGVETYPPYAASMTNKLFRPFWSPDSVYTENTFYPSGIKVRTAGKGVERNRISADCGWRSHRVVSSSGNVEPNDDVLLCSTPSANITLSLLRLRGKVFTFKKTDAVAHSVIIKSPSAESKIDGAEAVELTTQYQKVSVYFDGTNFQTI